MYKTGVPLVLSLQGESVPAAGDAQTHLHRLRGTEVQFHTPHTPPAVPALPPGAPAALEARLRGTFFGFSERATAGIAVESVVQNNGGDPQTWLRDNKDPMLIVPRPHPQGSDPARGAGPPILIETWVFQVLSYLDNSHIGVTDP